MKTALILTTATLMLAGTAHAGDMKTDKMDAKVMAQPAQTQTVSTRQLDGALITAVSAEQEYAVLGRIDRNGETLYQIADQDGDVFINHVPSDLYEVTTDVDEIDTYTYEYNGRTFTNRIVRDDADSVG